MHALLERGRGTDRVGPDRDGTVGRVGGDVLRPAPPGLMLTRSCAPRSAFPKTDAENALPWNVQTLRLWELPPSGTR